MQVHLIYRDRDLDLQSQPLPQEEALLQDLELPTLFSAMSLGSKSIYDVVRHILLNSLQDVEAIHYRQDVLQDCLRNASVVRELYRIAVEIMDNRERRWLRVVGLGTSTTGVLRSAVGMMKLYLDAFAKLRRITDEHASGFTSLGFTTFFGMIQRELSDEYLATIDHHLTELTFRDGVLILASLGAGNEGTNYRLVRNGQNGQSWLKRALSLTPATYSFRIDPRDDHGARAISDIKERAISGVANTLAQSADHINSFFELLSNELAFYVGCLNLYDRLMQLGEPVAFPVPEPAGERVHEFRELYDVCLALTMKQRVVGNTVEARDKDVFVITGANQGGKSTFLRSIGLAHLMMQAGMFVPAEHLRANLCSGLFTHYRRQEDATMTNGKLDEELGRMSSIVDVLAPDGLVLLNESFAATNEREGAEIAWQIVHAFIERRVKVFFVTHLYAFARGLCDRHIDSAIFLRADRRADGERTFRLIEGEPLSTSYGEDLYRQVFTA